MTRGPLSKDNEYYRLLELNRAEADPIIARYSTSTTEYAQLIFRNLILLNGGSLVLVPTVLSTIEGYELVEFRMSAILFVTGLVSTILAAYSSHWNHQTIVLLVSKHRSAVFRWIHLTVLENKHQTPEPKLKTSVVLKISGVCAQVFGLVGLACFAAGAFSILPGVN